jgi:activator of HSP90 ATPase
MTSKNLHQTVTIRASPHDVFESIVDPKLHEQFTGASAKLQRKVGGTFAHYDNSLIGFVVEIVRDKRLVLAWRSSDWAEGAWSIARFSFEKVRGGTRLVFDQFGIPAGDFNDIQEGWKQFYWSPLKAYHEG